MDFQLPAVTRYLADTGGDGSGAVAVGSLRESLPRSKTAEVTTMLSEQMYATSPPTRLPKALEAYFTGPAARGYSPPDLEAQYVVPFNKPPPPYRPPGGGAGQGEQEEPDPNGTHTARAVPPGSAPLALGPPVHSSVQTGHVAAAPTSSPAGAVAGADTVAGGWGAPMDWSHLFGTPAPAVVPSSAAAGGGAGAGASGDKGGAPPGLPVPRSLARMPSQAGSIGGASAAMTAVTGGGVSVLSRRTHNAVTAALPGTAEGKFCGAVVGVMDRLAATSALQAGGGGGGKYRSLRVQTAEHKESMVSAISLPPPPQTGAFSSRAAAARMAAVLDRSGASRDDMADIVRQIKQFAGLPPALRDAVSGRFQLFCYPPGSYLYEAGCRCDEAFVLVSGAVMLHVEGRPPQRLQPGSVLGAELLMRRGAVPLSATTDPHFEAQLAVLCWVDYEEAVRGWAAERIAELVPDLQASQVARLRSGLQRGVQYVQRQAGEPLWVGGQPADAVALLVQGQVLLASPWEANALVTENQIVSQLRVLMGPLADTMVLNEMPRPATHAAARAGGLRGGLKGGGGGSMRGSIKVALGGEAAGGGGLSASTSFAVRGRGGDGDEEEDGAGGRGTGSGSGGGKPVGFSLAEKLERAATGSGAGSADSTPRRSARIAEPPPPTTTTASLGKEDEDEEDASPLRFRLAGGGGGGGSSKKGSRKVALEGPAGPRFVEDSPEPQPEPEAGKAPDPQAAGAAGGEGGAASGSSDRPASGQPRRARQGQPPGRNSRNATGSGTSGEAREEAGPEVDASEATAEAGGDTGPAEAAADAGPAEGEATQAEAGPPPAESAAAASSRAARVSLKFSDEPDAEAHGAANVAAATAADGATAAAAPQPHPESQPQPQHEASAESAAAPPSVRSAGMSAEASLLPAVSVWDLHDGAHPPADLLTPVIGLRAAMDAAEASRAAGGHGSDVGDGASSVGGPLSAEASLTSPPMDTRGMGFAFGGAAGPGVGGPADAAGPTASASFLAAVGVAPGPGSGGGGGGGAALASGMMTPALVLRPAAPAAVKDAGAVPAAAQEQQDQEQQPGDAAPTGNEAAADEAKAAGDASSLPPRPAPAPRSLISKIGGGSQAGSAAGSKAVSRTGSRTASAHVSPSSSRRVTGSGDMLPGVTSTAPASAASAAAASVPTGLPPRPPASSGGGSARSAGPTMAEAAATAAAGGLSSVDSTAAAAGCSSARERPSTPMSEAPSLDDGRSEQGEAVAGGDELLLGDCSHPVLPPRSMPSPPPGQDEARCAAAPPVGTQPAAADPAAAAGMREGTGSGAGDGATSSLATQDGSVDAREAAEAEAAARRPHARVLLGAAAAAPALASIEDSFAPSSEASGAVVAGAEAADVGRKPSKLRMRIAEGPVGVSALEGERGDVKPSSLRPKLRMNDDSNDADDNDGAASVAASNTMRFMPARASVGGLKPTENGGGGGAMSARGSVAGHVSGHGGGGGGVTGPCQPLANALATQFKFHRQRVAAVYSAPVVFGEEALGDPVPAAVEAGATAGKKGAAEPTKPPMVHSAIATARCELILVPAALLRALLPPPAQVPGLLGKVAAAAVAAQRRLLQATGHNTNDSGHAQWPAAADRVREVLTSTQPGQRQPWQVELLAAAFSGMPAFARLTWQARLRVFQELEYRRLPVGSSLDLARLTVTEKELPDPAAAAAAAAARNGLLSTRMSQAVISPPPPPDPSSAPPPSEAAGLQQGQEQHQHQGQGQGHSLSVSPVAGLAAGAAVSASPPAPSAGAAGATDAIPPVLPSAAGQGAAVAGSAPGCPAATPPVGAPAAAAAAAADIAASAVATHASAPAAAQRQSSTASAASTDGSNVPGQASGSGAQQQQQQHQPDHQLQPQLQPQQQPHQHHTVEAVFDPSAEEPLIPSLALLQRASASTITGDGGIGDGSTPRGGGVAPTESALAAAAAADMLRLTTMYTAESSAPSVGTPFTPATPHDPAAAAAMSAKYANYIIGEAKRGPMTPPTPVATLPAAQLTAPVEHFPPKPEAPPAAAPPPQPLPDPTQRPAPAREPPAPPPATRQKQREAVALRLDDKAYWCIWGDIALEAAPAPPAPARSEGGEDGDDTSAPASRRASGVGPYGPAHASITGGGGGGFTSAAAAAAAAVATAAASGDISARAATAGGHKLQLVGLGDAFSGSALADATAAALNTPVMLSSTPRMSTTGGPGDIQLQPSIAGAPTAEGSFAQGSRRQPSPTSPQRRNTGSPSSPKRQQQREQPPAPPPPQVPLLCLDPHTAENAALLHESLPLGDNILRARVLTAGGDHPPPPSEGGEVAHSAGGAGGGYAEVLCMSKPMFELIAGGMGRSVPPAVLPVLARHVDWLAGAGVDLAAMAAGMEGRYKLEEHKQGTELLRAGEAAPAVFLVAAGECVMRGPVVGLRPGATAGGGSLDLATLREGSTCGELSLLAGRPLWYSLVVASPTAKVIALDLQALRGWLLGAPAGMAAAAEVVAAVAEVDIALYGRAVKQIAIQVLNEKLELSMFQSNMKSMIRRVIEDNASELNAILAQQLQQEAAASAAAAGGKAAAAAAAAAAASRPRTIVLEGWDQVEAIAASVARPYEPGVQSWELIAQARFNAARRAKARYLDSLYTATALATQEDAGGHAAGGQRVALPAPGPVAAGLAAPGTVRQPHLHDIRVVPKDLRGGEVEVRRRGGDAVLHMPPHELSAMMGAAVHLVAPTAVAAAVGAVAAGASSAAAAARAAGAAGPGTEGSGKGAGTDGGLSATGGASASAASVTAGASASLLARKPVNYAATAVSGGFGSDLGSPSRNAKRPAGAPVEGLGRALTAARRTYADYYGAPGTTDDDGVESPAAGAAAGAGAEDDNTGGSKPGLGATAGGGVAGFRSRLRVSAPVLDAPTVVQLSPGPVAPWDSKGRLPPWNLNGEAAGAGEPRRFPWDAPTAGAGAGGASRLGGGAAADHLARQRELLASGGAASTAWSTAPLEGHRGRLVVALSAAPSMASVALDPETRALIERQMEEEEAAEAAEAEVAEQEAVRMALGDAAARKLLQAGLQPAAAAGSGPVAADAMAAAERAASLSSTTATSLSGSLGFSRPGTSLTDDPHGSLNGSQPDSRSASRAGQLLQPPHGHHPHGHRASSGITAAEVRGLTELPVHVLASIGEEDSMEVLAALEGAQQHMAAVAAARAAAGLPPAPSALASASMTALPPPPARASAGAWISKSQEISAGGGGKASTLPPLRAAQRPTSTPPAAVGSVSSLLLGGGASAVSAPGPLADASSSALLHGLTAAAATASDARSTASGAAASTQSGANAANAHAAAAAARRSRIQARNAAPAAAGGEVAEAPDRAFWVRDRLHDPQGLASSVMADAAARAVVQAVEGGGAPPDPLSMTAPAALGGVGGGGTSRVGPSTSTSANVLLASAGRPAIPTAAAGSSTASGRSPRLQPLRRNASSATAAGKSAATTPRQRPSGGGGVAGGLAAAAPAAAELAEQGMLYVTLVVPPAPKLLPEFPSPAQAREAAEAAEAAERAAREARVDAAINNPATRPLSIDHRGEMRYVPNYLRQRQRPPLAPPPVRPVLLDGEDEGSSWVVPSYTSGIGFTDGFYDEDSQVIYFD